MVGPSLRLKTVIRFDRGQEGYRTDKIRVVCAMDGKFINAIHQGFGQICLSELIEED